MIDTERLLARFLRYVQVDTTAREDADSYPSSPGQLELGRQLLAELQSLGFKDAKQSEFGIVTATIPANIPHTAPHDCFQFARGYFARNDRRERKAAGRPKVRRS